MNQLNETKILNKNGGSSLAVDVKRLVGPVFSLRVIAYGLGKGIRKDIGVRG